MPKHDGGPDANPGEEPAVLRPGELQTVVLPNPVTGVIREVMVTGPRREAAPYFPWRTRHASPGASPPPRPRRAAAVAGGVLLVTALAGHRGRRARRTGVAAATSRRCLTRRRKKDNVVTPGDFTGFGFDQCLAPSQTAMDRWLQSSPFLAVGIYIAGDSRACRAQPNLDARPG